MLEGLIFITSPFLKLLKDKSLLYILLFYFKKLMLISRPRKCFDINFLTFILSRDFVQSYFQVHFTSLARILFYFYIFAYFPASLEATIL